MENKFSNILLRSALDWTP